MQTILSTIGPQVYILLSSLVAPAALGRLTMNYELVEAIKDHHILPHSEIVQKYHFNTRFR